jgi:hypothetical protein
VTTDHARSALGLTVDTLHEAAREIRSNWTWAIQDGVAGKRERDFHLAVADWLDRTARNLPVGDNGGPFVLPGSTYEAAVAVARAYLGEAA